MRWSKAGWVFVGVCIVLQLSGLDVFAWEGTVTRVLDGDSLRVKTRSRVETIRLFGIDCPEHGQAGWAEAKRRATVLMTGKEVSIVPVDVDRYGRTVAVVKRPGLVVNAELVRTGMAWVHPFYCKSEPFCQELEQLERSARQLRLGVWRDERPVPPWKWKQRHR